MKSTYPEFHNYPNASANPSWSKLLLMTTSFAGASAVWTEKQFKWSVMEQAYGAGACKLSSRMAPMPRPRSRLAEMCQRE
jgi:hypothetical protein